VYLGGGTPTLMRPRRIARIMDAIRPCLAPGAEVSMEANPETVDRAALEAYREAGITRLSLGAQSFQPHLLAALDRAARADQVVAAYRCARAAGFADVSMDLMFAVPGQSPDDLAADVATVLDLGPDHISWSELEMKPGSALARAGAVVDDEFAEEAYREVVDRLESAGYLWYETANFARPGHECRHSLAYWSAADYLGVGIGAVSTVGGLRWRVAPDLAGYLDAADRGTPPRRTQEELDDDTRRRERWMLGLRLARPLALAWSGPPDRPDAFAHLSEVGLLSFDGERVELSREGRFLQNSVLVELMEYGS
jgi:oxygen-independent coproporphyrinogen-3 oxidase